MMSQIQYMTAKEAADKWNISHRRVITLCQQNRIPNTAMLGNMWIIPKNAQKPGDLRLLSSVKSNFAKPFVKWAGGKGQLIPQIKKIIPKHIKIIDSGEAVAKQTKHILEINNLFNNTKDAKQTFYINNPPEVMQELIGDKFKVIYKDF